MQHWAEMRDSFLKNTRFFCKKIFYKKMSLKNQKKLWKG